MANGVGVTVEQPSIGVTVSSQRSVSSSSTSPVTSVAGKLGNVQLEIADIIGLTEALESGGGTPAGSAGQIQINDGSGSFGTAQATIDSSTGDISTPGSLTLGNGLVSIANTTNGIGVMIRGAGGSDYGQLRIVGNSGGWSDSVQVAYFQVETGSSGENNLVFMGGAGGTDSLLNRVQICSYGTTITDYSFTDTPVPVGMFNLVGTNPMAPLLHIETVNGQEGSNIIEVVDSSGDPLMTLDGNSNLSVAGTLNFGPAARFAYTDCNTATFDNGAGSPAYLVVYGSLGIESTVPATMEVFNVYTDNSDYSKLSIDSGSINGNYVTFAILENGSGTGNLSNGFVFQGGNVDIQESLTAGGSNFTIDTSGNVYSGGNIGVSASNYLYVGDTYHSISLGNNGLQMSGWQELDFYIADAATTVGVFNSSSFSFYEDLASVNSDGSINTSKITFPYQNGADYAQPYITSDNAGDPYYTGVALFCAANYEMLWKNGALYLMSSGGYIVLGTEQDTEISRFNTGILGITQSILSTSSSNSVFGYNQNSSNGVYGGYDGETITGSYFQSFGTTSGGGSPGPGGAEVIINSNEGSCSFNVGVYNGSDFTVLTTVTNTGYAGVNTTSPQAALHVQTINSEQTGMIVRGSVSQDNDLIDFQDYNGDFLAGVGAYGDFHCLSVNVNGTACYLGDDGSAQFAGGSATVDSSGNVQVNSITFPDGASISDTASTLLFNASLLQILGNTDSYPALQASGNQLQVVLADNSGAASISASTYYINDGATLYDNVSLDVGRIYANDYVILQGNNSQGSYDIVQFWQNGEEMASIDIYGTVYSVSLNVSGETTINSSGTLSIAGGVAGIDNYGKSTSLVGQFYNGDDSGATDQIAQIVFGWYGGGSSIEYAHYIASRHNASETVQNAIDFYVCNGSNSESPGGSLVDATFGMTINGGFVGIGLPSFNPDCPLEIGFAADNSSQNWNSHIRLIRPNDDGNVDCRIAAATDGMLFKNFYNGQSTSTRLFSFRDGNDVHIWDMYNGGRNLFTAPESDDGTSAIQVGVTSGTNLSIRTDGRVFIGGSGDDGSSMFQVDGDSVLSGTLQVNSSIYCNDFIQFGSGGVSSHNASSLYTDGSNLWFSDVSNNPQIVAILPSSYSPVTNGTYTVGIGVSQNGTISTINGIITSIQQAA